MVDFGFNLDGKPEGWFSDVDGKFYLSTIRRHPGGLIVELGTWQGRSLSWIMDYCIYSKCKVYAIDNWTGPEGEGETYGRAYKYFIGNMKKMGYLNNVTVLNMDSVEAAKQFMDESVDVLMIDTTHEYERTRNEINVWWPKIKMDGEMIGHDYIEAWPGVFRAVNEAFGKPDDRANSMWSVKKIEGRKK